MEEWRDIPGTNFCYEASNYGRVRSKDRIALLPNGTVRSYKGKLLRGSSNGSGYMKVGLIIEGQKKMLYVHRVVAELFCEKPNDCDVVNHKDFNPSNNRSDNLEWLTGKENYDYSFQQGRFERTPEWRANLKRSLNQVMGKAVVGTSIVDGNEIHYASVNDTALDGFSPSCVSNCCNGKRNTHKGFMWRFADVRR